MKRFDWSEKFGYKFDHDGERVRYVARCKRCDDDDLPLCENCDLCYHCCIRGLHDPTAPQ